MYAPKSSERLSGKKTTLSLPPLPLTLIVLLSRSMSSILSAASSLTRSPVE